MKLLSITLSAILAVTSASGYVVDEASAARAREFYRGLVLTQVNKFDEAQQTELALQRVGGAVCQAFDSYALFDLATLSKYGASTAKPYAVHVLEKGADAGPPKLAIVYRVCDPASPNGEFDPVKQKAKINMMAPLANVITDEASCTDLATSSDSVGNMYLVKDGKCVQSFRKADFAAQVEVKEGASELKQEWALTYTSRQKCAKDDSKDYTVDFQGVCVHDDKFTSTLTTAEISDCAAKIQWKSKKACYISYIPLSKYMDKIAPFTGGILCLVGAVMCFYGSKFLQFMIGFLVALGVTGITTMLGFNFLDPEKAQMIHFIVLLIAAVSIGTIAGLAAWKLAKEWGTTVLAFWLGIMTALMLLKLAQVQNQNVTLIACAIGGIFGAMFGYKYKAGLKKFGTAIIGSFILVRGLSIYIGNFPSEFSQGGIDPQVLAKLGDKSGSMLYYTIAYFIGFLALALIGSIVQFKYIKEDEDVEKEDAFDDEEEGKVCGIF